jgi:DNA-binding transcriptional LysR family regulator
LFHDKLFIITEKGLLPTQKANHLYPNMLHILNLLEGALTVKDAFDPAKERGEFTILASVHHQLIHLQKFVNTFAFYFNHLKFNFVSLPWQNHNQDEPTHFDAMVGFSTDSSYMYSQKLASYQYYLVCHKDFDLNQSLSLKRYLNLNHIVFEQADFNHTEYHGIYKATNLPTNAPDPRNIAVTTDSLITLCQSLANQPLVATLPKYVIEPISKMLNIPLKYHTLPFSMENQPMYLCWPQTKHNVPANQWLREQIKYFIMLDL